MKNFFLLTVFFFGSVYFSGNIFAQLNYPQNYLDVPNTREDYFYIKDLREKGIIDVNENFFPDDFITRAEFTKIVTLGTRGIAYDKIDGFNPFSDVSVKDWFWPYIQSARYYNFIFGYPNGDFKPGDFIKRGEALKIILKSSGLDLSYEMNHYRDFSDSEWFSKYANSAYEYGIFEGEVGKNGLPQGYFKPGNSITRGEMATWFSRALKLSEYNK